MKIYIREDLCEIFVIGKVILLIRDIFVCFILWFNVICSGFVKIW